MPEQNGNAIVKGLADEYTDSTPLNQLEFIVKNITRGMSTSIPVVITAVQAGDTNAAGYVDVRPLVAQIDAWGNSLPMAVIHHLPYFRLQAGRAAVVLDPVVGDIGLAVFAQSDCSNLKQGATQTVQPNSWRKFDQADGFYIGGFLNTSVDTYVKLTQNGEVTIKAPHGVRFDTPSVTVAKSDGTSGAMSLTGDMSITGDVTAGGISYLGHVHTCPHGGETSTPH